MLDTSKTYRTRDGKHTGLKVTDRRNLEYQFLVPINGIYIQLNKDGRVSDYDESNLDLIEEEQLATLDLSKTYMTRDGTVRDLEVSIAHDNMLVCKKMSKARKWPWLWCRNGRISPCYENNWDLVEQLESEAAGADPEKI